MVKDLTLWKMEGKGVPRTGAKVAPANCFWGWGLGPNLSCNPQVSKQRDLIIHVTI